MDPMELYVEKVKIIDKHAHDFTASFELEACDCSGSPTERLTEKQVKIHDLRIANLSLPYFFGNAK